MTDLKPQNTLYDSEYGRGMLIDLAGVVKMGSAEKLKDVQNKIYHRDNQIIRRSHYFEKYDEESINLHHFSAFAFGKFIDKLALNIPEADFCPSHFLLKKLSADLMMVYDEFDERNVRCTIEDGLMLLKKIQNDGGFNKESFDYKGVLERFIGTLLIETNNDLPKFGLNPELPRITKQFIELSGSQINPDLYFDEKIETKDLHKLLNDFLQGDVTMKDRVILGDGLIGIWEKHHFAD